MIKTVEIETFYMNSGLTVESAVRRQRQRNGVKYGFKFAFELAERLKLLSPRDLWCAPSIPIDFDAIQTAAIFN